MATKNFNNNLFRYVDLDLPSGTLWATCNVGAKKPSDCGKYFQWGETIGYKENQVGKDKRFDWDDYMWNSSKDGDTFTKYTTTGATLEIRDDAAHANMGGDWHMPTPTQINELINNTIKSFTTLNAVKGMKFASKKDSSKYIFIPAAGFAWDGSVQDSGDIGYIWSSVLYTGNVGNGQYLYFSSGDAILSYSSRYNGLSVRGVLDKKIDSPKGKKSKKNDELNLVEILKNAPKGTKLWSPMIGECELVEVIKDYPNPISCKKPGDKCFWRFKSNGRFVNYDDSECVIFPSKENKDWSTFNAPKTHKRFEPFQKVLIRTWTEDGYIWVAAEYSNYDELHSNHYLVSGLIAKEEDIIPYKGNENKLGKPANK